jgi:lipopolysaccharide export system protein LptA/lipopolysaccharide export system protein LptC
MRWQRGARIGVALVAVATITGVALTMRKRDAAPAAATVTRVDRKAVAESSGGRMTQATGMRIPGFIDYAHQFTYEDGTLRFVKPVLTTKRSGRDFLLKGNEATIGPAQTHMTVTGAVELTASDGLRATTDEATYSSGEQVVRVPRKIEFARGATSGSGVGMTYDQVREVMWLLDQAVITVAPDPGKDPGMKIVAGAAGMARREKYFRFDRGFNATREGRVLSSDAAMAYLTDDERALRSLELRGNSRIVMSGAVEGGLQSMTASEINLSFADDGETIQHAALAGTGVIQLAGAAGQPGRRIAGEVVDVTVGPDGQVTALVARDKVQLGLPAAPGAPERVITAATMDGSGEAGRGLTGARFTDNVEFREKKADGTLRVARSKALSVVLGAQGGVDDAQFTGVTRFEDGALTAVAQDARYLVATGQLLLRGNIGPQPPEVRDARILVKATTIDLVFEGPKMVAKGNVQSVSQPARKAGTPGAKPEAHVPGLLKEDQPTNVAAAALEYDGGISKAIYTGGSRLWQKDTAISGDTITLDEKSGDLTASGQVRTSMPFEQLDSKTNEKKQVTSIATSKDLHYEDAVRRATYTTEAHVNGPQGDLRAVKIEMYLIEGGGSLERVEAYDAVTLKADERTASGLRMTYFAADEKYYMTGSPVRIIEPCRDTTGKTLTFYRSTDRVFIDGAEEKRTLALGGGTCGQTSPK